MLTKKTKIDQIIVSDDGCVFYRTAITITDDGVALPQTYIRTSVPKNSNTDNLPDRVKKICLAAWS